ncbi:MAG: SdrD B-like domain-containing protein, partial [Chloroflexus sp.]
VTVTLYRADDSTVGSTTTAADGSYSFSNLPPGAYYLVFSNLPSGYVFTAADQGGNDAADSDASPSTGRTATFTLVSGQVDERWDAGAYQLAGVGDLVWFDRNGNGVQDASENGIANVTVTLYRADGSTVGSTTTAADGSYSFTNLPPGEYRLRFTDIPSGLTFSPADSGVDDATDSDVTATNGETDIFTLLSGQSDTSRDAGVYPLLSLGNLVWEDANNNGIVDTGESGVAGVQIRLYFDSNNNGTWDATDQVVDSTVTDSNGVYSFTNLPQGDYIIVLPGRQFEADSPWYNYRSSTGARSLSSGTYEPGAAANDDLDNDDNGTRQSDVESNFNIVSSLITLRPDSEPDTAVDGDDRNSNLTVDFGIFHPATVGDLVWNDLNGNGIYESTEPGVANVLVTLYDVGNDGIVGTSDDVMAATQRTDDDGFYLFEDVPPGEYYLVFSDLPGGASFTKLDMAGDDTIDSDADPTGGATAIFTLQSGTNDHRWDAGLILPATVGDLVWEDRNGNGMQDSGELGIAGVTVRLTGTDSDGNSVDVSVVTDRDGAYRFENLLPGNYTITVTPPAGYVFTVANRGSNDALDSEADPDTGAMSATVLESGEVDLSWDAGLYRLASIGNLVWEDRNGNGVQDSSESGVANVTVLLNGTTGAGMVVNMTTTTDRNGFYRFDNLAPGTYTVTVQVPAGYVVTVANQGGNNALDSDADPDTGAMNATVLESGEVDLTWDAGIFLPATLGNRVWHDINANGIAESGETGVSGITVSLYRADGTLVQTVVTDGNSVYLFTNLPPGDYYLTFSLPDGWVFSPANQGGDNSRDSDVDPDTQRTQVFTLGYGQTDLSWWAGIHQPAPPTAITLLGFTAERQANGVFLRWVTGSERDTLGFLMLRSSTGNRADATPILSTPIPAQGSAGSGASYQWFDRTAQPNVSYHYWLVEVETDGDRHEFMLSSSAVQFTYRVLVPIIQR